MSRQIGTNIVDKIVPFDTADTYPTHEDFYGKGGYMTINTTDNPLPAGYISILDALTAGAMVAYDEGNGRQKRGQIVYNAQDNRHYLITTPNHALSGADYLKATLPYEYNNAISTSFYARNANNTIDSGYLRTLPGSPNLIGNELYENCAILAGNNNRFLAFSNDWNLKSYSSAIVAGSANYIWRSNRCTIGGGALNSIDQGTDFSFIGGGFNNKINSVRNYSFIGAGDQNSIGEGYSRGSYSAILGGQRNKVTENYAFIGGGFNNIVKGAYSVVGGGRNNRAEGFGDSITGGNSNVTQAVAEAGSILYSKTYDDVDIFYALDTKLLIYDGLLIETIPGMAANGVNAAGKIQIYKSSNSFNESLTGRTIIQTIQSPSPSLSGRFGHYIYIIKNKIGLSTTSRESLLIVSEPGTNKVYLYSINIRDASHPVSLIQTIDLESIEPGSPSDSEFGYSIHFTADGNIGVGSFPFATIYIGAPGIDKVFAFKTNANNPALSADIVSSPYTLFDTIVGQTGSRFGHSVVSRGLWPPSVGGGINNTNCLSGVFLGVGAPNQVVPTGQSSGAINIYVARANTTITPTNRSFETFTFFNSSYQHYYNPTDGDQLGDSFYNISVIPRISLNSYQPAGAGVFLDPSVIEPRALSAYGLLVYTNTPNKSVVYTLKLGEGEQLEYQTFTTNLDYTLTEQQISTGYVAITCTNLGIAAGTIIYNFEEDLTLPPAYQSNFNTQGYGGFSVFGQQNFANTYVSGPNDDTSGIYSYFSILTGTNYKNLNDTLNHYSDSASPKNFSILVLSKTRKLDSSINALHPGTTMTYLGSEGKFSFNFQLPPYPAGNFNTIQSYGFTNIKYAGTELTPGIATFYYLSAGKLSYSNAAMDLAGETTTNSAIIGGENNSIKSKTSIILGGQSNVINPQSVRSVIFGGQSNVIQNTNNSGVATINNVIGTGFNNVLDGSSNSSILNGRNNKINIFSDYSTILGGQNNIVNQNVLNSYILGSNITAVSSNTTYVENLVASGHLVATTKSFYIDHPIYKGKKLQYGSLESPYHGIRLTGKGVITKGSCVVELPNYIYKLVKQDAVNIQLTNIKHNKILYVDSIDVANNKFTVKVDSLLKLFKEYEFFWTFTAIRNDVPDIQVEC